MNRSAKAQADLTNSYATEPTVQQNQAFGARRGCCQKLLSECASMQISRLGAIIGAGCSVVSITRLRVRSWRYILPFIFFTLRSSRQAKVAEGDVHVALLRDAKSTFWTRTVWTTEAAMKSFMLSGPHRQVMPRLLEWCDEAAVAQLGAGHRPAV